MIILHDNGRSGRFCTRRVHRTPAPVRFRIIYVRSLDRRLSTRAQQVFDTYAQVGRGFEKEPNFNEPPNT